MTKRKSFRIGVALVAILALWVGGLAYAATTTSNVVVISNIRAEATGTPAQGSIRWELGTDSGQKSLTFTNGSGSGAVSKVYVAHLTATTTIDLDGSLVDPVGSTISFSRIAQIRVIPGIANAAAGSIGGDWVLTKYLVPGGDTLSAVTIPLNKLGFWQFMAPDATGVAVTATTGDGFTVTLSGSDTADVVILGS